MKEIKTKSALKHIKVLDKAVNVSYRAKNTFIRSKKQAEERQRTEHGSYVEYAEDKIKGSAKTFAYEAGQAVGRFGQRAAYEKARQVIRKKAAPDNVGEKVKRKYIFPNELAKQQFAQSRAKARLSQLKTAEIKMAPAIQGNMTGSGSTVMRSDRFSNKAVKENFKGKIKTAQKSIKLAERSVKAGIKTSEAAAKSAQAAQKAAQAAQMGAKAAEVTAKTAVKAMVASIKAIIAAVNGLLALITVGGWMAIVIILVMCLTGLLLSSPYGVLFSNVSYDQNTPTMRDIISQVNEEFAAEILQIQNENLHGTLELSNNENGITVGNWRDILAVYAVKVSADLENSMEVVTLDDVKMEILQEIFWDMNKIDYWLETIGDEESSTTILHINVTSKSYTDMIAEYSFNLQQVKILNELMQEEYQQLFLQLIGT